MAVVGSSKVLGCWDVKRAVPLKWTAGDIWVADCTLEEEKGVEYKYIKLNYEGELKEWMPGRNLVLELEEEEEEDVMVEDSWEPILITHITEYEQETNGTIPSGIAKTPVGPCEGVESSQGSFQGEVKPEVPSLVEERDLEGDKAGHSPGKNIDIGGPSDVNCTAYGPEWNPILLSIVEPAVVIPLFPYEF